MGDESIEQYQGATTEELLALHGSGRLSGQAGQALERELLRRGCSLPQQSAPDADSEPLKGVGGWLLFFIFFYTLSPFFVGGQYYVYQSELRSLAQWFPELENALHIEIYLAIGAALLAAGSALTFYIVYALLWEKPNAVFLAKLGLLLFIANNLLIAPLLKFVFFGYLFFSREWLGEFMLAQAAISLPAVAWYGYFCRSKRVKITYGGSH